MNRRTIIATLTAIALVGSGLSLGSDAEAKRLGGGRTFGKPAPSAPLQRQATPAQSPTAPTSTAPTAAPAGAPTTATAKTSSAAPTAAAPAASRSRWMGPLAGIAAGLGIAALASALGIGEELMGLLTIMLLGIVAVFAVRFLMSMAMGARQRPAMAGGPADAGSTSSNTLRSRMGDSSDVRSAPRAPAPAMADSLEPTESLAPADDRFMGATAAEVKAFEDNARRQFIELQSLWDQGKLEAISELCSPDVFAEIAHQHHARGGQGGYTGLVSLEVELLSVHPAETTSGAAATEALVRFSGLVREDRDAAAEPFAEVWLLQRESGANAGWMIVGIEQESVH